ncbi:MULTISPECIES: Stealth CR1 domain-containing protein [unclassified Undibacterium]|uniref:Stealth CR1 domain-containing protein n=1 Tax=unclassified Undibacterium TaxID=2630295 RepID=UPI002AC99F01|nr:MULTISPECIES: Stealth CR1 domain-containing protein [unclassified Undibacterium]MEB0141118.1 Stealth CR1 domain-containing protein [Undibacterium sp. CCC2.1]MEB0174135.1 Stealth CR1 domain-containing protein [Undibacterium sp. CCC1.1]MEB0177834.1 Stealth CR1 domain-containing protein [Undibacterium sp. CCC3.4]MEB0217029.1 Stealth CR1 domain-containing protein [Undibacterium sp. 5I2]WPX41988.1 Stealth CR1 domain-containing protein [Undibacterium sp. CCC3.4]
MSAEKKHTEPVDIVYLWVDGADPLWQNKRQQAYTDWVSAHPDELAIYGNNAGRYRDNGELLYNLRALEKFFPAHGHVYLVSDGQVPAWLQPSARLTVIDHRDLLPASTGPVFDSGHIESYLHHIPGLSERFIYLNDDVFFGSRVDTAWWFGGALRVFGEVHPITDYDELQVAETALVNASILSKHWLSQRYPSYQHDPRLYSHAPRPMLKSVMFELEEIAAELFEQVRSTVFRSWRVPPLVPDLVPRWMVHTGLAKQRILDPLHIHTGDQGAAQQFDALLLKFGQLPFFCINDTCDEAADDDLRLLRIALTLEQLLPLPSSFEQIAQHDAAHTEAPCPAS